MNVIITGGAGFLGGWLAARLLERGAIAGPSGEREPIARLVLFDAVRPTSDVVHDPRVDVVVGEVSDAAQIRSLVGREPVSVFHLASMVSAGSELDFDGALRVNLDGARAVLDACRLCPQPPRFVFSSSIVAYGGVANSAVVSDETKLTPETTYGMTKAVCELLVNDYTRKGFVDGRSARLPTVVIRPGRPNAAASSWVSGLFREPLNGEECIVPVDRNLCIPIAGYRTTVDNLLALHDVDGGVLGADRSLNFPALDVTAGEMLAALQAASDRPLGPVVFHPDPNVTAFFGGWAQHSAFDRATAIGLPRDESVEAIVRSYIADYLEGPSA